MRKKIKIEGEKQSKAQKDIITNLCVKNYEASSKIKVLFSFLDDWQKQNQIKDKSKTPIKVLIFSQTKKALSVLECLSNQRGYTSLRLDGEVPSDERVNRIAKFNEDNSIFIFFLTTRVGGLGINLKSANKVVIFDPDWNPMVDLQATDRALRIG